LYTPGEFGSFFGFLYPGGSNIPEAIAFGRIAGENAAAEKPWES
jgi:succinate dehydrogenase/fumarate reductase flavoprotein subunit